jgi:acyl transferase domain-containing protein/NADPH:quinone reductase-like Zn-dependent oxidoreductase/acyl carrier protein/NAD(P)-dependent dehydrogenase (short-subunit alcohol dehydrogenase family)
MIRAATELDILEILTLEKKCWLEHLRASKEEIAKRIENFGGGQFLLIHGTEIAGVLFTQRIPEMNVLRNAEYSSLSGLHNPEGGFLQFISIAVDVTLCSNGAHLLREHAKDFALNDPTIHSIVAVTRCSNYKAGENLGTSPYEEYVHSLKDPTIFFHVSGGAKIQQIVSNYRAVDHDNFGNGILIQYELTKPSIFTEENIIKTLTELKPMLTTDGKTFNGKTPLMNILDSLELMSFHQWLNLEHLKSQEGKDSTEALSVDFIFRFSTVEAIVKYFQKNDSQKKITSQPESSFAASLFADDIAIVGIGMKFPGEVESLNDFWEKIVSRGNCITNQSLLDSKRYQQFIQMLKEHAKETDLESIESLKKILKFGGYLKYIDHFDPSFFGLTNKEEIFHLDPNQRLLLECTAKAIYDSNRRLEDVDGENIGVFVGLSNSDYQLLPLTGFKTGGNSVYNAVGGANSMASGRISFLLGISGPSHVIDTACSSSLVAIHQACQAIKSGECSEAIVAASNLILTPWITQAYHRAGMLSPDGCCHTFDSSANGYVRSEGVGALILKPLQKALQDGDKLYGVIKGSAVFHHGKSASLTAPNSVVQETLLQKALTTAGKTIHDIDFLECHGTGTKLGDPIEVTAIANTFQGREKPLLLSSIKGNIGHLEASAGLAGMFNVFCSFQSNTVDANANLRNLNPNLIPVAEKNSFLTFPQKLESLPGKDKRLIAGVSSFGYSGTIAHVILEQPPSENMKQIKSIAIDKDRIKKSIVFQFSGQGKLKYGIFQSFSKNEKLLSLLKECETLLLPYLEEQQSDYFITLTCFCLGLKNEGNKSVEITRQLEEDLSPGPLFHVCILYCYAKLFIDSGVRPTLLLGHSLGEYAAAVIANIFTLKDCLSIIAYRSKLITDFKDSTQGQMIILHNVSLTLIQEFIQGHDKYGKLIFISVINQKEKNIVLTGKEHDLNEFLTSFQQQNPALPVQTTLLPMRYCYHSPYMSECLPLFRAFLGCIPKRAPEIPILSTLQNYLDQPFTGNDEYWLDHLTLPVNYAQVMEKFFVNFQGDEGGEIIEIGCGYALTNFSKDNTNTNSSSQGKNWKIHSAREIESEIVKTNSFHLDYHPQKYPYYKLLRSDTEIISLTERFSSACLQEHRISEILILPGAAMVELSLSSVLNYFAADEKNNDSIVLEDFMILNPIQVHHSSMNEIEIAINEKENEIVVSSLLTKIEDPRIIHSRCSYKTISIDSPTLHGIKYQDDLSEDFVCYDIQRFYQVYSQNGLFFGCSYRLISSLFASSLSCRGYIEGRYSIKNESTSSENILFPPQLLDALIHSTGAILYQSALSNNNNTGDDFESDQKNLFVPFHIELLEINHNLITKCGKSNFVQQKFFFQCNLISNSNENKKDKSDYFFDCYLFDEEKQECIIRLHNLHMRKYSPSPAFDQDIGQGKPELVIAAMDDGIKEEEITFSVGDLSRISDRLDNTLLITGLSTLVVDNIDLVKLWGNNKNSIAFENFTSLSSVPECFYISKTILFLCDDGVPADPEKMKLFLSFCSCLQRSTVKSVVLIVFETCSSSSGSVDQSERLSDCFIAAFLSLRLEFFEISFKIIHLRTPSQLLLLSVDSRSSLDDFVWSCYSDSLQSPNELEFYYSFTNSSSDGKMTVSKSFPTMEITESLILPSNQDKRSVLWKYELQNNQRGSLDHLLLVHDDHSYDYYHLENQFDIPEGFALVEVFYVGCNFRDVLNILGMYPGNPGQPGCEFSGRIVRTASSTSSETVEMKFREGDCVIGFHTGCLQSFILVPAFRMIVLPSTIPLEVGCMIPIIYTTIEYCFQQQMIGGETPLRHGDCILIHSGCGGVGLVAIQYAKYLGLTILTTVNKKNFEKYHYLKDVVGIPEENIFSSRDPKEFHCEISNYFQSRTDDPDEDKRLVMVINSLSDEFIPFSLEFLSPQGSFFELGKRNIWTKEKIRENYPLANYFTVEIDELALNELESTSISPNPYQRLLASVCQKFQESKLSAIHYLMKDFITQTRDAFLLLRNGLNIGKIILKHSSTHLLELEQTREVSAKKTCAKRSYVITGGTGSLGFSVAFHLLTKENKNNRKEGIDCIYLLSRSGEFKKDILPLIHKLYEEYPSSREKIVVKKLDCSNEKELKDFFAAQFSMERPLVAVFHCAGVVKDSLLSTVSSSSQNYETFMNNFIEVWSTKTDSARILYDICQNYLPQSPSCLVFFSSIISKIGRIGQSSYSAANRFLDEIASAHVRNHTKSEMKVISLRWPAISDIGMAASGTGNHVNGKDWQMESSYVHYFLEELVFRGMGRETNKPLIWNIFPSSIMNILDEPMKKQFPTFIQQNSIGLTKSANKALTNGINRSKTQGVTQKPTFSSKKEIQLRIYQICQGFYSKESYSFLEDDSNLIENGLDSLAATEFANQLEKIFQLKIPGTFLFNYSSIRAITERLIEMISPVALRDDDDSHNNVHEDTENDSLSSNEMVIATIPPGLSAVPLEEVVIIGMSCAFPGEIYSIDDLYKIQSTKTVVTNRSPSEERLKSLLQSIYPTNNPFFANKKELLKTIQFGGYLSDSYLKDFSYKSFEHLTLLEANKLDIRQKLALKITLQCLQENHISLIDCKNKKIGIYVACLGQLRSSSNNNSGQPTKYSVYEATANSSSVLSGRISFTFGFEGPCMTIDTACSSSLVAIHVARQALQLKECDLAMVVSVNCLDYELSIPFGLSGMLSVDGKCQTFDGNANGYVRSEGCAAVLLSPLSFATKTEPRRRIFGVIKGSAIMHDGKSASLTSPNGLTQDKLLQTTLAQAGLRGEEVNYIETHGTGTKLGDPIEVEAILKVYGGCTRKNPLFLSSVKGNIGHLEASAGLAGLFAVVNSLHRQEVFPNANLTTLNPEIQKLLENYQAEEWMKFPQEIVAMKNGNNDSNKEKNKMKYAGLSSFGYSGTIAHCIIGRYEDGQEEEK